MHCDDEGVCRRHLHDGRPCDPDERTGHGLTQVFGPFCGETRQEDHGGGRDHEGDPDQGLLRDRGVVFTRECEDQSADQRESEREEVGLDRVVLDTDEERHGRTEGGDLSERQIDENDPALDHVQAEVGVGHEDDHGHHERRQKEV